MDCLPGCSVRGGCRGLPAVRVLSGQAAGAAFHGLSAGVLCSGRPPGASCRESAVGAGCRGCVAWTVSPGSPCPGRPPGLPAVRWSSLSVPRAGPFRMRACVRSPVRSAIPPKRMLCANRAFSRSPAKGGRAFCVRPVPMPRSRGCRALRRVRRCGAVRRVRPFRAWGRGCRGRASRP